MDNNIKIGDIFLFDNEKNYGILLSFNCPHAYAQKFTCYFLYKNRILKHDSITPYLWELIPGTRVRKYK